MISDGQQSFVLFGYVLEKDCVVLDFKILGCSNLSKLSMGKKMPH